MEKESLQETAKMLTSLEGNVKGELFRNHAEYIKHREGEEAVKKVEKRMAELGAPVVFDEIKSYQWTKEGLSALVLLVAKDIFNWKDEDIYEMGRFAPKVSFIISVLVQYFVSTERVFNRMPEYWRKHFDFGELESFDFEDKDGVGKGFVRVKDYNVHPVTCLYHSGYFKGSAEFTMKKGKEIDVEEVKCVHRGDPYHEHIIYWK